MSDPDDEFGIWPATTRAGRARAAALRADAEREEEISLLGRVAYESEGWVLVVGGGEACRKALPLLEALPGGVVLTEERTISPQAGSSRWTWATGRLSDLTGHLGRFSASVETSSGPRDLGALLGRKSANFDLVLDLGSRPIIDWEQPPVGYFAVPNGGFGLEAAADEIKGLLGRFEKPVYVAYAADICAHGRNGITGCTRCLDACPTHAIRSAGDEGVVVDTHLCQGGGSCASACPSGAIRYVLPSLSATAERLRRLLLVYRERAAGPAELLFHDRQQGREWVERNAGSLPESLIAVDVEEIGAVGPEIALCALAYGAARVSWLLPVGVASSVRREIEDQTGWAGELLEALGYGRSLLLLHSAERSWPTELTEQLPADASGRPAAGFAAFDEKRTMAFLAIDHLHAHAPHRRPLASLPAGSPFGMAQVDGKACTLCMSCVGACPGKALEEGSETPRLAFVEANCLQCGMCTRICPENAIFITPRFLFSSAERKAPRTLHEEEPFYCVRCGKPFGTRKILDRMRGRLAGHWMFQNPENLRRLEMCEDCRVKDMLERDLAAGSPPGASGS